MRASRAGEPERPSVPDSLCFKREMPQLSQAFLPSPVTALAFSPVGFPIPLVVAGEGSLLKVFSRKRPHVRRNFQVFQSQAIHGVQCKEDSSIESDPDLAPSRLRCLVWGGRSVIVVILEIEECDSNLEVNILNLTREAVLPDWILHGSLSPREKWTDGFKEPFVQAMLVTAHNELYSLQLSRIFESDQILTVTHNLCSSGPPSILYAAQCLWRSNGEIIVAVGTMFGEVQTWKCAFDSEKPLANFASGKLLQSLLGHEGSVFGVHIVAQDATRNSNYHFILASCSDDRTVRLWDVSDSFTVGERDLLVCQSSQTGFGTQSINTNRANLASAVGHMSRIWNIKVVVTLGSEVFAFSFGEDATAQIWRMPDVAKSERLAAEEAPVLQLEKVTSYASHSGKHIWSSDIQLQRDGSVSMVTGGADGRIVVQVPIGGMQGGRSSFNFARLHEIIQPISKTGLSAKRIFDSMSGSWLIRRKIVSVLSSYPSGTFEGTAILTKRQPTDSSYDQEMLYSERGKFTTTQGLVLEGSRRYVYRYENASNRITAWFVTLDADAKVDYLFHQVTFEAMENQPDPSTDIVANGHHLCVKDDYNAEYMFPSASDDRLHTWSLRYLVKGPSKDYTASATYTRPTEPRTTVLDEKYSEAKPVKEEAEAIKAYCWLSATEMLATTSTGHVLCGSLTSDSNRSTTNGLSRIDEGIDWNVLGQLDDLRSHSLITPLHDYGAVISGTSGALWLYQTKTEKTELLGKLPRRIAGVFAFQTPSETDIPYGIVATCLGSKEATLFLLASKSDKSTSLVSTAECQLILPNGPNISSVCYLENSGLLLIGLRTGSICIYNLPHLSSPPPTLYPFTQLDRIHGRDSITSIQPLSSHLPSPSSPQYILTTGRDGHLAIHLLTLSPTPALTPVHTGQPPLGPFLEDAHLFPPPSPSQTFSQDLLVWGFRGAHFVLWNATQRREVFSVDCGGAGRSWAFRPDKDGEGGSLVWTRKGVCEVLVRSGGEGKGGEEAEEEGKGEGGVWKAGILQAGAHGREVRCVAERRWEGVGDEDGDGDRDGDWKVESGRVLLATGSEDTSVRLQVYGVGEAEGVRTVGVLGRHSTGVQRVEWSSDGDRLFSCGGKEEFFVWRVRNVPCVEVGVVFEAGCPPVTEGTSDLRIMDFVIEEVGTMFKCSMVYSDSSIRVWSYDYTTATFALLAFGVYNTNCLTQITSLTLGSTSYLVTAATDGHIAIWPHSAKNAVPETPIDLQPITNHRIHQSCIKSLVIRHLNDHSALLATGGDDNGLGLTIITANNGLADEQQLPRLETLLIPKAHTASITALQWPDKGTGEGSRHCMRLLSASNDQVLKSWDIHVEEGNEAVQGLKVRKGKQHQSEVADVACMETLDGGDWKRIALAGVGMETWKIE